MNCRRFFLLMLVGALGATSHLQAQVTTFEWTGSWGSYYGHAENWTGQLMPPNDGTALISFGSRGSTSVYSSFTLNVAGIAINAGNRIYNFSSPGIDLGAEGLTYSSLNQDPHGPYSLISAPITLRATQTWQINSGRIAIDATLNNPETGGPFNLTKTGAGTLAFLGNSSGTSNWTGNLTVLDGRILLHPSVDVSGNSIPQTNLGTGTVTFDSTQGGNPTLSTSDWLYQTQSWSDSLEVILPNAVAIKGTLKVDTQAELTLTGGVKLLSDATINLHGNPLSITSPISDNGSGYKLTVDGYGIVVLDPATQAGNAGPLNTYSGGTHVQNGGLIFANEFSLPASGLLTMSQTGYIGYGSTVGVANFLGKFDPANAAGTIGFDSDPQNTTKNVFADGIDLSGFNASVRLGSATSAILNGIITPAGTHYQFGGGGGKLVVNSTLTNAGEGGVIPRAVVMNSHPYQPLAVWLTNTTNSFTGGAQATQGALIFDPGALPVVGSLTLGTGGYIGTAATFETDQGYANHLARFVGNQGVIGFDIALGTPGARTISHALTLPASYSLGTVSRVAADSGGYTPGLIVNGTLTGATEGANEVFRFAAYKGGYLEIASNLTNSAGKVYIGDPDSLGSFGDPNEEEYSVVALTGNNTYGGTTTLYTGHLVIGQSNEGYGTAPTTALGTGALVVQPNNLTFPGEEGKDDIFPLLSVMAPAVTATGPMIIGNLVELNHHLGLGGAQNMRLTNTISGIGGLYIGEESPNGITVGLEGNNTFSGGVHVSNNSTVIFGGDTSAGTGLLSFRDSSSGTAEFLSSNPVIHGLESDNYSTISLAQGSTLTIDQTAHNTTFRGTISSAGQLALMTGPGGAAATSTSVVVTGAGSIRFTNSQLVDNFRITGGTVIAGSDGETSAQYIGNQLHLQGGAILLQNTTLRSNLTLESGTIAGHGYVLPDNNAVPVIGSGLVLSPGSAFEGGIGQLTFNELTLASQGLYIWNLRGIAQGDPANASGDMLQVSSPSTLYVTATAGSPFVISAVTLDSSGVNGLVGGFVEGTTYTWNLMSYVGIQGVTEQFNPSNILLQTGGLFQTDLPGVTTLEFTNLSGSGQLLLHFTAVPEPSTYALMALGLGFVAFTLWRRRRAS